MFKIHWRDLQLIMKIYKLCGCEMVNWIFCKKYFKIDMWFLSITCEHVEVYEDTSE